MKRQRAAVGAWAAATPAEQRKQLRARWDAGRAWAAAKWGHVKAWFAAVVVVLSANMAAAELKDGLDRWLKGKDVPEVGFLSVMVYLLVFVAAVWWLYRMRRVLFYPRTRWLRSDRHPPQREHLVLFLSNLFSNPQSGAEAIPTGLELSGDWDTDFERMIAYKKQRPPGWRWEMPLRGIRHHLGKLKTVTLLCSPESVQQAHCFGEILQNIYKLASAGVSVRVLVKDGERGRLRKSSTPRTNKEGWDFEHFDDLSRGVQDLLLKFKKQGAKEDQIVIDFTGGLKITSVVAAAVTFNRKIKNQYVQTNPPYDVVGYDILLTTTITRGMGW